MASLIRRLIDRFYPDSQGARVTIVGLDYSGKTTLLYLLKLGQIVPTTPSIGFNVETIDITTSSSKRFRMTGWEIGTGCGGLQFLYGMIRVYVEMSAALVWVVDSCDQKRLQESIGSLSRVLANMDADASEDKVKPKLMPILM
jgi:GTPase SAR1 family protein